MTREQLGQRLKDIETEKIKIEEMLKDKSCFITDCISWTFKFENGKEIILDELTYKNLSYHYECGQSIIDVDLKNGTIDFDLIDLFLNGNRKCCVIDKYMVENKFDVSEIRTDYYKDVRINNIHFESGNEIGSLNINIMISM